MPPFRKGNMQQTLLLSTYHTCFYRVLLCNKPAKLSSLKWQPFFAQGIGHLSWVQQGSVMDLQSTAVYGLTHTLRQAGFCPEL